MKAVIATVTTASAHRPITDMGSVIQERQLTDKCDHLAGHQPVVIQQRQLVRVFIRKERIGQPPRRPLDHGPIVPFHLRRECVIGGCGRLALQGGLDRRLQVGIVFAECVQHVRRQLAQIERTAGGDRREQSRGQAADVEIRRQPGGHLAERQADDEARRQLITCRIARRCIRCGDAVGDLLDVVLLDGVRLHLGQN